MFTIALGHLLARGVQLTTLEAVALAQELLGRASGIPSARNVLLAADGSAACVDETGAPSVHDIAALLQELLPAGTPQVPAPLRYAIARGLQAVEAPPFATLGELSHALQRFEGGERREVLRGLLRRVTRAPRSAPVVVARSEPAAVVPVVVAPSEPAPAVPVVPTLPAPAVPVVAGAPVIAALRPLAAPSALDVAVATPAAKAPQIDVMPKGALFAPEPRRTSDTTPFVWATNVARVPSDEALNDAAPLFGSVTRDVRPVPPSRRNQRLIAAAAILASFGLGFGVIDLMSEPGRANGGRTAVPRGARTGNTEAAARREAKPISPPASVAAAPVTGAPANSAPPAGKSAAPSSTFAAPPASTTPLPSAAAAAPDASGSGTPAPVAGASAQSRAEDQKPVATGGRVERVSAVSAKYPAAFSPAFASNGTAIFFHTGGARDASSAIEVATSGGSAGGDLGIMTVVDDGSRNYHAQPSPDGRFVAFDSDRDGERGVYIANRDGSKVHRVSGDGYAAAPSWSRDGEQLAYIRAEGNNAAVWNLWVQPAAGGAARRLTNHKYGQTWAASWFPDSQRICYTHESKVYVLDLRTGQSRHFDSPVKGAVVRTPAVSPDGGKVIFQVYRHGAWVLDLADGSMLCVLTDPTAEEFAWAPDGRRVAFHSRRDGRWGIYVMSRG